MQSASSESRLTKVIGAIATVVIAVAMAVVLLAGCQNTATVPPNAGDSALQGISASFALMQYGPAPVPETASSVAYYKKFSETLQRRWNDELHKRRVNTNQLGEFRIQFHERFDGSISDVKVLANTLGDGWGLAAQAALSSAPPGPWPAAMCQTQYAGYFTFRAVCAFRSSASPTAPIAPVLSFAAGSSLSGTYLADEQDPTMSAALSSLFTGTYPSNLTAHWSGLFETDPDFLRRGFLRARTNNYPDAIAEFNAAIAWDPEDAWAYNWRGECEAKLKDYKAALRDVSMAVELDPKNASAWNNRANAHRNLKAYQDVLSDATRAMELHPGFATPCYNRAYARMRLQDFSGALADARRSVELAPTNASAFWIRGRIRYALRDYAGAMDDSSKAIQLNPKYGSAYSLRGYAQQELSHDSSALDSFKASLERDPTLNYSRFQIWVLRAKAGESERATRELRDHLDSRVGAQVQDWPDKLERFLAGLLTEDTLLDAAQDPGKPQPERNDRACEAYYYAGIKHLSVHDKRGALALFQKSITTAVRDFEEYIRAEAELRELQNK